MSRIPHGAEQYMAERGYVTVSRAAQLTMTPVGRIYRMIREGKIHAETHASTRYITVANLLDAFADAPEPIRERIRAAIAA